MEVTVDGYEAVQDAREQEGWSVNTDKRVSLPKGCQTRRVEEHHYHLCCAACSFFREKLYVLNPAAVTASVPWPRAMFFLRHRSGWVLSGEAETHPNRITKSANGITAWADVLRRSRGGALKGVRVHLCAKNPCVAKWDASKYWSMPVPIHLQPTDWRLPCGACLARSRRRGRSRQRCE
jgi:hypothetical protein